MRNGLADATELMSYFRQLVEQQPSEPHWAHGVEVCERWASLLRRESVSQNEIDEVCKRLRQEPGPGSGWVDLTHRFNSWARGRGFTT